MSKSHLIRTIITLVSALSLFTALQADPPDNKGKSGKAKNELKAENDGFNVDFGLSATVTAGISFGDARMLATRYDLTGPCTRATNGDKRAATWCWWCPAAWSYPTYWKACSTENRVESLPPLFEETLT